MSGRARTSSDGSVSGRSVGNVMSAKREFRRRPLGRRAADQHRERVPRYGEILPQRRQQRAVVGELTFGRQHVDAGGFSGRLRDLHELQVVFVDGDDVLRRLRVLPARSPR